MEKELENDESHNMMGESGDYIFPQTRESGQFMLSKFKDKRSKRYF